MRPDHLLHVKPTRWGVEWRLECLPGSEHFTADLEEWTGTADELEAQGVAVDRTRCWVHDHLDNADDQEEWMKGDDWPEDGPWPVMCSYPGGLDVEYIAAAEQETPIFCCDGNIVDGVHQHRPDCVNQEQT